MRKLLYDVNGETCTTLKEAQKKGGSEKKIFETIETEMKVNSKLAKKHYAKYKKGV